uniref:Neuronal pentraxin-1-like n=1 Tax=Sinocyclocheilus anshuiensis TaxID=1608454 RepID=A0A671PYV9_9TELE
MSEWLFSFFFCAICFSVCAGTGMPGSDYNPHPRFICTPIPADADPGCFPTAGGPGSGHHGGNSNGWWRMSEEAKATILHLRESLVQQKETILDQRETIRELTAKLNLCEGLSRTPAHLAHHAHHAYPTAPDTGHLGLELGHYGDGQMSRVLQSLKERLDNLQTRNTSTSYSSSLKDLLQRKISALEQQMQHHSASLTSATLVIISAGSRKNSRPTEAFQIGFPMRTNYMYGRVKRSLLHEIFSFTLCLWMKAGIGPGLGTPFSYSVPGQANELVLIEWGNNPMELLVDDRAVTLPLSVNDGKWHHVCVTWSTRDGLWEAYQDGVKRGSGENLSPWHPIKPGGVFILGQEQDTLGGRFDATQAFVGEISDVQMWSHVLTPHDIYSLASCGGHMTGDIIAWAESVVELHGGVTKYPFDPCH